MSQAGARGPGAPTKPPAVPAVAKAQATTPVAPVVGAVRGVSPARVAPAVSSLSPKTTMMGVHAPQRGPMPTTPVDDAWGPEPSDDDLTQVGEKAAPTPPAPPLAVTPPAAAVLSAVDLRLIMREMIDQAVAPLMMRIAELEKRPRAQSSPAFAPQPAPGVRLASHQAPTAVAPSPAPPVAYPSAMAVSPGVPAAVTALVAPRSLVVPLPPLLDVAAIERDVPLDLDFRGFDGGRRKRRAVILFVVFVLIVFGGLFAMLAESYSHTHN